MISSRQYSSTDEPMQQASKYDANSFEKRTKDSENIRAKYPDRVPCIVERSGKSKNLPVLDKKKYLVPNDLTFGQFIYVIRKRINIKSDQALFLFIDNTLPPSNCLMSSLYNEYKDATGFLMITYAAENTFG